MEAGFEDTYSLVEERHPWFVRRRELFAGMVAGGEHERILDVGCGTGAFLEHLRGLGFRRLTGVEPSAALRQRFRLRDAPIHERIPDGEFDVVFMLDVLEHIDDDRAALAQVRERLRPGGRFFLSVPAHPFLWSRHDEVNLHRRRYRRAELVAKLEGAGFGITKLSYWHMFAFPPIAAMRVLGLGGSRGDLELGNAFTLGILGGLLGAENRLARRFDLPFGVSLIAGAERPRSATP